MSSTNKYLDQHGLETLWAEVKTYADAHGDKTYTHIQGTPSQEWNVTHDLGKYPSVTVIASTASPYKFARCVMEAVEKKEEKEDDFVLIDRLAGISGVPVPARQGRGGGSPLR